MKEIAIKISFFLLFIALSTCAQQRPHIIYILADDLGWNDVGYTGQSDLQTPNIDALAYNGRILTRHYSMPTCTPSRAALLTAKYSMRLGMQGYPLSPSEPRALSLHEHLMPQYFKELGYQTHLLGKWHLGYHQWKYTPIERKAFDSFFGYFNGFIGYYDHEMKVRNMSGHDFWRNDVPQYQLRGRYVTDLLTEETERLIDTLTPEAPPLFILLSHMAPHAGNPGENDLEYPEEDLPRFNYIPDMRRRKYAAMVWNLDKSVGRVIKSLADKNVLNNTIIVFASDNGAQTTGIYHNDGSNFPLKGLKFSAFEGGVHTTAAVWSPMLHGKGLSRQLFHISDWLPTLYAAAGGNIQELSGIDGRNQWPGLLEQTTGNADVDEYSARQEMLVQLEERLGQQAIIHKHMKLVTGSNQSGLYDVSIGNYTNENYTYDVNQVTQSPANNAFKLVNPNNIISAHHMTDLRIQTTVNCNEVPAISCDPITAPCLFDLRVDPCERVNLATDNNTLLVVVTLQAKLNTYMAQLNKQLNVPNLDTKANPRNFNDTWYPWNDFPSQSETTTTIRSTSTTKNPQSNSAAAPSAIIPLFISVLSLVYPYK